MQKEKLKGQKGITLIALIITIIVMLILVGVSITVALNGGLFKTAKDATDKTEVAKDKEYTLSTGEVEIEGLVYSSIDDYTNNNPKLPDNAKALPEEEIKAEGAETANWDLTKVTAVEVTEDDGTTKKVIPLPKGYQVSLEDGENTISEGLVITDGENEFVWIPVAAKNFINPYPATSSTEPKYLTGEDDSTSSYPPYDSQTNLNHYYGSNHYTINPSFADENGIATNTVASNGTTFDYGYHYNEMVTSVNKYGGFYIGRYETTIDGSKIGSKEGATVLTADQTIEQTNNKKVRWWGLYALQRNSNVVGNGSNVQTNMVWGQQWDAMITYFDNATPKINYEATTVSTLATSGRQNAGQAKYTNGNSTISDEIYNIFDLRGNILEWTAEANDTEYRVYRGGDWRQQEFSVVSWQR